MKSSRRILSMFLAGLFVFAIAGMTASAQTAVAPVANPCPRLAAGSSYITLPACSVKKGVLLSIFLTRPQPTRMAELFLLHDAGR